MIKKQLNWAQKMSSSINNKWDENKNQIKKSN